MLKTKKRGWIEAVPVSATAVHARGPALGGPTAIGALAVGAGAIGALAIGRLAIGRASIERLSIGELEIGRLRVDDGALAAPATGGAVLKRARVVARIPASDLERARAFYADKLGLQPDEERDGGLLYRCGAGEFGLFASAGAASGAHTQLAFEVDDIEAAVAELSRRGVVFEEYDLPGMKTVGGIADIEGNYPSKGTGERGAWFRDSEGNMLGLGQPVGDRA